MSLAALRRPFSLRALPGLLIVLIPIIEFFGMGYKMACARMAMSQNYELPKWRKNWKQLFIFGAGARFIQAIWLTPAASVGILLWFKLRAATLPQEFFAIRNLLVILLVLLILAAIFAPACILNYVAEARFKAAFSLSVLRRMFSKAYLIGWLITGIYTIIVIAVLFGFFFSIGNLAQTQSALLIGAIALPGELIIFWLPGITIWTLLGEAWGKSLAREQIS